MWHRPQIRGTWEEYSRSCRRLWAEMNSLQLAGPGTLTRHSGTIRSPAHRARSGAGPDDARCSYNIRCARKRGVIVSSPASGCSRMVCSESSVGARAGASPHVAGRSAPHRDEPRTDGTARRRGWKGAYYHRRWACCPASRPGIATALLNTVKSEAARKIARYIWKP